MVTDTRLRELVDQLGRSHAQAVWDAGLAAIHQIDTIVRGHGIDCGFGWVDGYLHAPMGSPQAEEADTFRDDAALARELGFDADVRRRRARWSAGRGCASTDRRDSIRAAISTGSPARSSPPAAASTSAAPSTSSAASRSGPRPTASP